MVHYTKNASLIALAVLIGLSNLAMSQEFRTQSVVNSGNAAFDIDLSSVAAVDGASIEIKNKSNSPVAMPEVALLGSPALLSRQAILDSLGAAGPLTDQQFAIAAWKFMMDHTQPFCSAGSNFDYSLYTADPMRLLHGYGFGCCDQLAAALGWLWSGAGYQTRIAMFSFHAVPEIYYGNGWHMLDPDHRVYYLSRDNVTIASVDTILSDSYLIQRTADQNGLDPVGWSAQTMANLYVANASTLTYSLEPGYSAPVDPEFVLRSNERFMINSENLQSDVIYHDIGSGSEGQAPASVTSGVLSWDLDYSIPNWGNNVASKSGVDVVLGADGRAMLTNASAANGYVVYTESTPYPVFALSVNADASVIDTNSLLLAYFSADGVTWSNAVTLVVDNSSSVFNAHADLSSVARGAYSYFVKLELAGGGIGIRRLQIRPIVQVSKQIFPSLIPSAVNHLIYRDSSAVSQTRSLEIAVAIPSGKPLLKNLTAVSLIPEDPYYSLAQNYSASHLIDGDSGSLAYPASTQVDYIVKLGGQAHVTGVSIEWGMFGTNPIYIQSWSLYGRVGLQDWQVLASGSFPAARLTSVLLDTSATDLKIRASSSNWIGIYEFRVFGARSFTGSAPATAVSNIPENPFYSISQGYGAANLVDGNVNTLAYPAALNLDYSIDLTQLNHISSAAIKWGYFGMSGLYVQNWSLLGRNGADQSWQQLAQGTFPNADTTVFILDTLATQLRVTASSPYNWIGIYELVLSRGALMPAIASSNVKELSNEPGYGPASALVDGDTNSLAYPADGSTDYTIDLQNEKYVDSMQVFWGYFGTDPEYINKWRVYGLPSNSQTWEVVARGSFPNSTETTVLIQNNYRKLRIATDGPNWTGIYEVRIFGF